jgi:hypothetical protein
MLDKSRGLALGPELRGAGVTAMVGTVTAATYNTTTGVGTVTRVDINNQSFVQWTGLTTPYCRISVTCTSGLSITVRQGTFAASGTVLAPGESLTFYSPAPGGIITITGNVGTNGFTVTTIRESAGNHAVQATTAARPFYGVHPFGGRRNLLERTEDFTVSPWAAAALGTSTRTNTTTPYSFGLGLITVTSANGGIRQSRTGLTSGQPYTLSFYLESATPNINVVFENGASGFGALHTASIDPSTGVFSGVSGFTSTTSVTFGTGRIYTLVSAPAGGSLIANIEWRVTASSGTFLLGRPQFEASATATAYQRVTDQYNVTEAGVASVGYLFFDGADSMSTSSVDFTATGKMNVFGGVRKLNDAAYNVVVDLSADPNTNLGAFNFGTGTVVGDASRRTYSFGVTRPAGVILTGAGIYAAPTTNVFTGIGDISGDRVTLRVNGAQVAQLTDDQGAGNFGNFPMFIGARNGSGNFFSGNLYSLIVRGASSSSILTSATEGWVASKTGVVIA